MQEVGTWRRVTDEPLETRFTLQTSNATVAALRRRAGELGISGAELARQLILEGLQRLERDETNEADQR